MSVLAKRELLVQVAPRYVEGCRHQRRIILDEFVAATGYERKYAIRLLNSPVLHRSWCNAGVRHGTAPQSRRH
jgi:hypothetical protein